MPFPLAHPAAVLPWRRYCPHQLDFPALVIGSLIPDLGYAFGHLHVDWFSHRFWAGSFGFCLPAGLVVVVVFNVMRSTLHRVLPTRYRKALLPLCERPTGSAVRVGVSLLLGAWTHILLDSITHEDGWLVEHYAILRTSLAGVGRHRLRVSDLLYVGFTFSGVAWLTLCYLRWLETVAPPLTQKVKSGWAILLASATLFIATASRGPDQWIGIIPAGIITVLLVTGFLMTTGRSPG